jgi:seryl-tRNA synthetase
MAAQPKLPGTLPTPAQARVVLRDSRALRQSRGRVVEGLKLRAKHAAGEVVQAAAELDAAETDLEVAGEGTPEDVDANARHGAAMRRMVRAKSDAEKVSAALALAKNDLRQADAQLAAAREDLESIRQGRRHHG